MQFPAWGRSGGWWGVPKEHQRPLKAIKNLSAASPACQLASHTSPCGAPGRQPWLHTQVTVFAIMCVWVCARTCVWGSRIKIPLHLEAQTPWAGALKAAIRHAAVWGKVTVYLHCHPTSLTQTLGRSLLHPPLHHVLHLLSERWVDRAQQEGPVRTIFWCARSADPFNKYPGSLVPVYSFFFIYTFISNTSTMEHVKVAFTTEREDGMYDKKQ